MSALAGHALRVLVVLMILVAYLLVVSRGAILDWHGF